MHPHASLGLFWTLFIVQIRARLCVGTDVGESSVAPVVLMQTHLSVSQTTTAVDATCSVMMPLWAHANAILGQEPFTEDECWKAEAFYNWRSSDRQHGETQFRNGTLFYIPIWKNAHQNIFCNLVRDHEHWTPDFQTSKASSFSFVRVPLPRFTSAYSELEFRIQKGDANPSHVDPGFVVSSGADSYKYTRSMLRNETVETFWEYPEGSQERASALVKDIVSFRFDPAWEQMWHLFSQVGPLRNYSFDAKKEIGFVGRLERISEPGGGWEWVTDAAGEPLEWDDECETPHVNTDASSGSAARDAMDELLAENGPEEIAMACAVYLPDEVCLGYEVPSDDCVAAGFAKDREAWEELLQQVRETMCPDTAEIEDVPEAVVP